MSGSNKSSIDAFCWRDRHRHATRRACAWLSACLLLVASGLTGADAPNLLDDVDRELLGRLGPGIVHTPIAAIDPATLIEAFTRPQTASFTNIEGPKKGQQVELSIRREKQLPGGAGPVDGPLWALAVPGVMTQYVVAGKEGLHAPMIVLGNGKLATHYLPPEPVLLRGVAPGKSKSYEMQVKVHPATDAKKTKYTGRVLATYSNKGSYRFETPAGVYEGVVIRGDYKGKLGPATMDDNDLRIFSPKVGIVAIVTHDRLHALLVVNRDKFLTLLRAEPPPASK